MTNRRFTLITILIMTLVWQAALSEPLNLDASHMIFHFHGDTADSQIGIHLKKLGDINNDGFDDFTVSSEHPKGTYIFLGNDSIDNLPDYFLQGLGIVGDYMDYDGDSILDIVIGSPDVIYLNKGNGGNEEYQLSDSINMPDSLNQFGLMAGGDLNNNEEGDLLAVGINPWTGGRAYIYLDPFVGDKDPDWEFAVDFYSHTITSGGFVDYNGDGIDDLFLGLRARLDTLSYVYIFLGPNLSAKPDYIIGHPLGFDSLDRKYFAQGVFNVGDIRGNGYDALGIIYDYRPFIYNCEPNTDTIYDYNPDANCESMANIGDINGDSYNDLAVGGSDSYYGRVVIFLGGPHFDNLRDDEITYSNLPDYFLDDIGWKLTSAGDVNNDGLDDILFSCRNWAAGAPYDVFVFSGDSELVVDVKTPDSLVLPEGFRLEYNYPNPFNSSTTIEFEIPKRQKICLGIYDILGREILELVNEPLAAGHYSLTWDGCDKTGNAVSSGIYIYRLKTESAELSKKMILLK